MAKFVTLFWIFSMSVLWPLVSANRERNAMAFHTTTESQDEGNGIDVSVMYIETATIRTVKGAEDGKTGKKEESTTEGKPNTNGKTGKKGESATEGKPDTNEISMTDNSTPNNSLDQSSTVGTPGERESRSSDASTKRLLWLVPTIVGSGVVLIIVVACFGAIANTRKKHGTFDVGHDEDATMLDRKMSGRRERGVEDPDPTPQRVESEEVKGGQHPGQVGQLTRKPSSLRRPQHLAPPDNRGALSVISWGSEFDVASSEDLYTNECVSSPPPAYPAVRQASQQQTAATLFRNHSISSSGGSMRGRQGHPYSPTQVTVTPASEPPIYSETGILGIAVPTNVNQGTGGGIYSNLPTEEDTLYANTNTPLASNAPAIPPRR